MMSPLTETIRALDESFGKEYFTLKDIFIEERRKILQVMLRGKLKKFAAIYEDMYDAGKSSIYHLQSLGLKVPDEFKISAGYALSRKFNDLVAGSNGFIDDDIIQQANDINFEAKIIDVTMDKKQSNEIFGKKLFQNINRLVHSFEVQQAEAILDLFYQIEKLELQIDIAEAQNTYFTKIYHRIGELIDNGSKNTNKKTNTRKFILMLLDIGNKLNINTDFYRKKLDTTVIR